MPTTESPNILVTPGAKPEFIDASDPRGPWRARRDWASGDLYFNAGTHFTVYVMLFFGLAMLAVSFAFAYVLFHEVVYGAYRAGDYGMLLPIVIAGFVGIGLTVKATLDITQGLKWRGSHFHFATCRFRSAAHCEESSERRDRWRPATRSGSRSNASA
jgi:hypothetical protein